MKPKLEEECMDILLCLIIPIAAIVANYVVEKRKQKASKLQYEQFVTQFSKDVMEHLKQLPKG